MSQSDVAEKLFLRQQTISKIEKKAMDSFKQALEARGLTIKDLLRD
jgi:transcriptional regulator